MTLRPAPSGTVTSIRKTALRLPELKAAIGLVAALLRSKKKDAERLPIRHEFPLALLGGIPAGNERR